uniref:helix-turn-helix domain-containing protein n=1 Tax=uncultured Tyzzerella sp. TaxID=2321398 RepID=UPI0029437C07
MSKNLGTLLYNLRKELGINQKELSRGICSITTLSRFESGEREPSKIVFDTLISKLGKNSNKWEIISSENDKSLIRCKNYIDYLIKSEKWLQLEEAIKDYKKLIKIDNNLNEQYICFINAIIYK